MKRTITAVLLFFAVYGLSLAQIRLEGYKQKEISPELFQKMWNAHWISVPKEPLNEFGVYHFRKTFDIKAVPSRFIVHVSADNRYKLYLNGHLVSLGPARGDVFNWNFETVDLSPWLKEGKNVLAATVWNYAELKPLAQISFNQTGFILQGNTSDEEIVNTNETWKCIKNSAYNPKISPVRGYFAAGPGESVNANDYPWNWENVAFDDQNWLLAAKGLKGYMKGGRDYPGRLLVPSPIPPMEMKSERFQAVRLAEGVKYASGFPNKKTSLTIPANSKVRLLIDQGKLTTGYLTLDFSKGKDAVVEISYAEALYADLSKGIKGNRNETEGKKFLGYADLLTADGGDHRSVTSLWWRTWRYVNVSIETAGQPLVIDDIYGTTSMYPFQLESSFSAEEKELNKILDTGWLTARLCANETYMDCPYYEQLQYFGDTRIQALISMYNTRDPYLIKNHLEQGRQSMVADGITMSRYPSGLHQFISSYSLWWICSGYDYWMYRGDEAYLKSLLPAYRSILSWYEQWLKPDSSLAYIPFWFFGDWAAGFKSGEPVREDNGNSAFQDLQYLLALDNAIEMEETFGMKDMAEHYKKIAQSLRAGFDRKYWDAARNLYADTYDHKSFSQHVNIMAVLAGIVSGDKAKSVMETTLSDSSLIQATIYFRFYLNQALNKAGLSDQLLDHIGIWRDQLALGLTTWAEQPEPSRSDCHAWGASLNIEFFRILLGIDSASPGFKKVRIQPALGKLKNASGSIPHPKGTISVSYVIDKNNQLKAEITLPSGTEGTFIWKNKEYALTSGKQTFNMKE